MHPSAQDFYFGDNNTKLPIIWASGNPNKKYNVDMKLAWGSNWTPFSPEFVVMSNLRQQKHADSAISCSFLQFTDVCSDNYHWVTLILKRLKKRDVFEWSSAVFMIFMMTFRWWTLKIISLVVILGLKYIREARCYIMVVVVVRHYIFNPVTHFSTSQI